MRGYRVIDATRLEGTITSTRGGIEVRGQRVPLEDVGVVLLGATSTISGGALTMLAKYDVVVLNLDWRGVPDLVAYGWSDNSRVARRHRMQAEISTPRRKSAWQRIIKAKLEGQRQNLLAIRSPVALVLERLRSEVRSGDPANCEAQGAKAYWDAYLGETYDFRRIPGAADRLNSLLNYGYTVMRGFVIRAIASAGLCPTYGLWHRNRSNTFVLADDVIEPFRPAIDHCVHSLGNEDSLEEATVKRALVSVLAEPMSKGRGPSVQTCIFDFAMQLATYIEGGRDKVEVPVWKPPSGAHLLRLDAEGG